MAGTAVDLLFFPIDTIKTRLQSAQGFTHAGGFKGIYKGLGSVVVGSALGGVAVVVLAVGGFLYLRRRHRPGRQRRADLDLSDPDNASQKDADGINPLVEPYSPAQWETVTTPSSASGAAFVSQAMSSTMPSFRLSPAPMSPTLRRLRLQRLVVDLFRLGQADWERPPQR